MKNYPHGAGGKNLAGQRVESPGSNPPGYAFDGHYEFKLDTRL